MNKQLIDALKSEPYSKKELLEIYQEFFPSKSKDTLRKRLERDLSKLDYLGLIEERGDKYFWYIYINFLDENYEVKLGHSNKLIPALRRIAGEKYYGEEDNIWKILRINDECLESHLMAYPEIYEDLQEYRKLKHKVEQDKKQLMTQLNGKVKKAFGEKITEDLKTLYSKSYVRKNIPSLIYRIIASKSSPPIRVEREEIVVGDVVVAGGSHLFDEIREFLLREIGDESNISTIYQIEKMEEEALNLQKRYQKRTLELIMKINSGEPLKVKCNTCPEVYDLPVN